MALRNRVTPTGEIVAVESRGTMMGNRGGCLHDDERRIVRTHRSKAWLICLLEFKGRRRRVMQPGLYTELFFLDEATALAAGHRPCFECRRGDAVAFARALTGVDRPRAGNVDAALHPYRLPLGPGRPTWTAAAGDLPDGTFVRRDGGAWLVAEGRLRPWSFDGYGPVETLPDGSLDVLTPKPTVHALRAGYRVTSREL
ncbi:MAG TPA: hypothetical protein VFD41_09195 [Actinomycetales bacterium]|nr:hypothetical protein [Actinomycetales bacterium]